MVLGNFSILVQAIDIATKHQTEEAPPKQEKDTTKDKHEEKGKETEHSGEPTHGEEHIKTIDVAKNEQGT